MAPLSEHQMRLTRALAKRPKTKMLTGFGVKPTAAFSKPAQLQAQALLPGAQPPRRRVRVLYEDPDATDSDTDDEEAVAALASSKRCFELFLEFYQDLLRGLQLPDIDPMDFRAGLDALDVSEASAYLDGEQDLLLGDLADEDLELDMDLDIGDDFLEMPGCDFGRGMDDFLQTVDFCV
uniref:Uncharacterized protein n=1 Tax=Aegilops tauschii TaxID=37682 RepID=M8BHH5_AEGTA